VAEAPAIVHAADFTVVTQKPAHAGEPYNTFGYWTRADQTPVRWHRRHRSWMQGHGSARACQQSGMFWTVRGADAILALRCCQFNGRFEDYGEAQRA
jgi:hypothetical protein